MITESQICPDCGGLEPCRWRDVADQARRCNHSPPWPSARCPWCMTWIGVYANGRLLHHKTSHPGPYRRCEGSGATARAQATEWARRGEQ